MRDYFGSPWAAISLVAAIILISLTFLQTYFSLHKTPNLSRKTHAMAFDQGRQRPRDIRIDSDHTFTCSSTVRFLAIEAQMAPILRNRKRQRVQLVLLELRVRNRILIILLAASAIKHQMGTSQINRGICKNA
ncbi:hypothetical protein CKAN_00438900 [Cinnamomum micranthum f. kanehirae]|uniref:Uncharacterized protein n=1 Tax=Cinnamomum micranthum f. kanehirae TaxID=337451 RepID=A0A443NBU2_9MAGN|nr:hypothetical protein CKAN_00438900 [Cinnamomum micranthum f. kanehirae]